MDLFWDLISSPWFWADVLLSVSGGLIVYYGHSIQKNAESFLPPQDFRLDIFGDIVAKYKGEFERGWRIVKIGVIVEVIAALGISVISGLEIAALNKSSANSNLVAKQAGKDAAEANQRAKQFEVERIQIENDSQEIRKTNLLLQTEVLKLESQVKGRFINADAKKKLVDRLSFYSPKGHIEIVMFAHDREAISFGNSIKEALVASGFNVQFSPRLIFDFADAGTMFRWKDSSLPPPAYAEIIASVFVENGIVPVNAQGYDSLNVNDIQIIIGRDPIDSEN